MYAYNEEIAKACESGRVVAIKKVIDRYSNDKLPIKAMLFGASVNGHDRATKYLIDHCRKTGYPDEQLNAQLEHVLSRAVQAKHTKLVRMLLKVVDVPEEQRLKYIEWGIKTNSRRMVNSLMLAFGYSERKVAAVSDLMEDMGTDKSITHKDILKEL